MAQDDAVTRETVHRLASDILALSENFVPSPNHAFTPDAEIVKKAKELIAIARPPQAYALNTAICCMEAAALRTLLHLKALQAIPVDGYVTLQALASKTKVQASLLARLLRALVSTGMLIYSPDEGYSHTPISAACCHENGDMFALLLESGVTPLLMLPDWLDHTYPPTSGLLPSEPTGIEASTHNPLTYKNRAEGKTAFDILMGKPDVSKALQQTLAMSTKANPVTGFYDYGKLALHVTEKTSGRKVLIDVGGGHGHAILAIIAAHPELTDGIDHPTLVLQDRTEVLAAISGALPAGVETQVTDFFTLQPVQGAKAYHIRACLHDWSDDVCVDILKSISQAMSRDSVLLIAENLVPQDPAKISRLTAFMDMGMLVFGGKERTEADFEMLAHAAGLKVNGIYRAPPPSLHGIVECVLV